MPVRNFFVEDERSARRFLRAAGFDANFDEVKLMLINKHDPEQSLAPFLDVMKDGNDAGALPISVHEGFCGLLALMQILMK